MLLGLKRITKVHREKEILEKHENKRSYIG